MPRLNLLLAALAAITAAAHAEPVVFNASKTAGPGQVIGLQGAGFGQSPEVLFQRVNGSAKEIVPTLPLEVLHRSDTHVSAVIPRAEPHGLYAVQVRDGERSSALIFINRAWSWSYDHHDEAFLGANLRLWGRNLCFPGAAPRVRFVHPDTGQSVEAATNPSESDACILQVKIPQDLAPDVSYRVFVTNGFGGDHGETEIEQPLVLRAANDPLNLGEAWGRHFTFAGNVYNIQSDRRLGKRARGDGVTDDRDAVQAAIDQAAADGGGVVHFPPGTYLIKNPAPDAQATLSLRSNVVLAGEHPDTTILKWGGGKAKGDVYFFEVGDVYRGGLRGLKIDSSGFKGFVAAHGWHGGEFFFKDCSIDGQLYLPWKKRFLMTGCYVQCNYPAWSFAFYGHQYAVFKRNHFYYVDGRVHFSLGAPGAHDILWEDSRVTRDPEKTHPGDFNEYGGLELSSVWNLTVLNSVFDQVGTQTIPEANDTETILNQDGGGEHQRFGTVTAATENTLTDESVHFPPTKAPQGEVAAIVRGKGAGQWAWVATRSGKSVTLRAPWQVIPDSSSKYTVTTMGGRNWLVKGNELSNRGCRSIWLYSTTHYNMNIVGNRIRDGDGIDVTQFYMSSKAKYGARFNASFGLYVAENVVENATDPRDPVRIGIHLNHVESKENFGTAAFLPEFRRNVLRAFTPNNRTRLRGEGYWATVIEEEGPRWLPSSDLSQGLLGPIFDGNTAIATQDAYRLTKGVAGAVIFNRTNTDVVKELLDYGSAETIRGPATARDDD